MSHAATPAHPFRIQTDLLDRMINFEIADDPHYSGLEMQAFDDPAHGKGHLVFLIRRQDGRCDVYAEPQLRVDRSNYEIGNGLGTWSETEFDMAHLTFDGDGVRADVGFTDIADRRIEVHIVDHTPRGRRTAAFLAPMGADIDQPRSLPLVWMSRFDLLRRSRPEPFVEIDGRRATTGRLPMEPLIGRRLIKVASDLFVVSLNPAISDPTALDEPEPERRIIGDAGSTGGLVAAAGSHQVRLLFDPGFPALQPGTEPAEGDWTVEVDGTNLIGGLWRLLRIDSRHRIVLDVTRGWQPRGLPVLMSIVTRVAPVFRTWPTTYRWIAEIGHGEDTTMTSRWTRTTDARGESYRTMTGSK